MTAPHVPNIGITSLFRPRSGARDALDLQILRTATTTGIMTVFGLPDGIHIDAAARQRMLRFFAAPRSVIEALANNTRDPSRPFLYHGWFGARPERVSFYEGMDIGPDVAHGCALIDPTEPLKGHTPMPAATDLPGWRMAISEHYLSMECVADKLIRSIARSLMLHEDEFARMFVGGASSLRLLRYPVRASDAPTNIDPESLYAEHDGKQPMIASEAHTDFGCLTLLVQDTVGGLQARMPDGAWVDIPPSENQIVVNFGKLLERWTNGRIRAIEHRVLAPERERYSIPFFYEPRLDTLIEPLVRGAKPFEPFLYGDYVWESSPRFRRLFGERVTKQMFG